MLVTIPFENSPTSERWDPRRTAHYLLQARRALVFYAPTLILMNLYYMGVNRMSHGPLNRPFDKGMPFSHVGTSARGVKSESTGRLRREF